MLYAFDLDGTLVDTKDAVLRAYRAVGVEPPEDFFGRTWREWLTDEDKHEAKNLIYVKNVGRWTKRLGLMDVMHDLRKEKAFQHRSEPQNMVYVLTGASHDAAKAVLNHHLSYPQLNHEQLHTGLRMEGKAAVLNDLQKKQTSEHLSHSYGIYFDDDEETCNYIRENTKWTVLHVRY